MRVYLARPANPRRGDVMVFTSDNQIGRDNRRGLHTNYGYSGFVVIVIWDGNSWAALTRGFRESIGITTTEFSYRYEVKAIMDDAIEKLLTFVDTHPDARIASWWYRGRKYAIFVPGELVRSEDAHRGTERLATEVSP